MKRLFSNARSAWILAILVAASSAAADLGGGNRIGGLTGSGHVWTNDALLPSGSSVHAGDEIRTGQRALGVLEAPAFGRLEVRTDSRVRLDADSVELQLGTVASSRAAVHVRGLRITPKGAEDNWFIVRQAAGETLVAAYRGGAVVQVAGAAPFTVPAGSYALAAALPSDRSTPKAEPQEDDDDSAAATGRGAAQAGKKGGWKLGSLASPEGAIILTGAAAAAVAGVVATGGTRDEAASPQD